MLSIACYITEPENVSYQRVASNIPHSLKSTSCRLCLCLWPARSRGEDFLPQYYQQEEVSISFQKPRHMPEEEERKRTLLDNPQAIGLVLHNGLNVLDIGTEFADLGLVKLRGGFRVLWEACLAQRTTPMPPYRRRNSPSQQKNPSPHQQSHAPGPRACP